MAIVISFENTLNLVTLGIQFKSGPYKFNLLILCDKMLKHKEVTGSDHRASKCPNQKQSLEPGDSFVPFLGDCHENQFSVLYSQIKHLIHKASSNMNSTGTKFCAIQLAVLPG